MSDRRRRFIPLLLVLVGVCLTVAVIVYIKPRQAVLPLEAQKLEISKETTFFTGPLDADGHVDYFAAVNNTLRGEATPETNAVAALWQVAGQKPTLTKFEDFSDEKFQALLGLTATPKPDVLWQNYGAWRLANQLDDRSEEHGPEAKQPWVQQPWQAEEHPEVAQWLRSQEKVFLIAEQASQRPHWYFPLMTKQHGSVQQIPYMAFHITVDQLIAMKELFPALRARCMLQIGEANHTAAWQSLLTVARIACLMQTDRLYFDTYEGRRQFGHVPKLLLTYMERTPLTAAQLETMMAEWDQLPNRFTTMAEHFDQFVRPSLLLLVQQIQIGKLTGEHLGALYCKAISSHLNTRNWNAIYQQLNERIDAFVRIGAVDDPAKAQAEFEQLKASENARYEAIHSNIIDELAFATGLRGLTDDEFVTEMLHGTLRIYVNHEQFVNDTVKPAIARLFLSLEHHRMIHGSYPENLTDLDAKLLPKADVFQKSIKQVSYSTLPKGYTLSSVPLSGQQSVTYTHHSPNR